MAHTRSFASIGPSLWNRLPPHFRSFILSPPSLSLSLALRLAFFLYLKCTESASVWHTPWEALYKYLNKQYVATVRVTHTRAEGSWSDAFRCTAYNKFCGTKHTNWKIQCSNLCLGTIHLWRPHGGGRGQAQVDACGRGEGVQPPCGRPHRKLKLEYTDVILSSSRANKLASFLTRISSLDRKKRKFFCDIN